MVYGVNNYSKNYFNVLSKYGDITGTTGLTSTPLSSAGSASAVNSISSINRVSNAYNQFSTNLTLNATAKKFLSRYSANYNSLSSAAQALSTKGSSSVWSNNQASSSNTDVVDVKNGYASQMEGRYEVNVRQLAQAQSNQSVALDSKAISTAETGTLMLNTGNQQFKLSIDPTGKTNEQVFKDVADAINANKTGLTAKVITKDGQSSLQVTGQKTGMQNEFAFSGDLAEQLGLNQVTQQAQDAIVDVTNVATGQQDTLMDSDNQVNLDSYRVSMELKDTGKSIVDFGVSADDLVSSVQKLVDSYNDTVKLLNDNNNMGTGVGRQLKNLLTPAISEKSMELLGLSYNKDGTLALDEDTLKEAYATDSDQVKDLLGGRYSVAESLSARATSALTQSSQSLVNGSAANSSSSNDIDFVSLMNSYSRRGAYNLMNYNYIGSLLNTLV